MFGLQDTYGLDIIVISSYEGELELRYSISHLAWMVRWYHTFKESKRSEVQIPVQVRSYLFKYYYRLKHKIYQDWTY